MLKMEEVRELVDGEVGIFRCLDGDAGFKKGECNKITVDSDGLMHNINDKPSYIEYYIADEFKKLHCYHWFNHGIKDRLTGPTFIIYQINGKETGREYWIKGKRLTQEQWELEVNRVNMLNEI